jgi:putative SOS response-associated peptidase YedK
MCGRYTRAILPADIEDDFQTIRGPTIMIPGPSWNVAPTQEAPIVGLSAGRRVVRVHRWGLVPSSAPRASAGRTINVRAESVATSPTTRAAFARRRCLVPATGFYEWLKADGHKLPHLLRPADQARFAFAGLWEAMRDEAGELRSFAVVTTTPNEVAARVHDRMPVILHRDAWDAWLDPASDPDTLRALLAPYPSECTEMWPVGPRVGSAANDDASLVERVESPVGPGLFR